MREMKVELRGGRKIDVLFGDFRVETDQPKEDGSPGSAPEPFDLFLASLASCAAHAALAFCRSRDIGTEDLGLVLRPAGDPEGKRMAEVEIELRLPQEFPEK
jgi:putative redox protein